MTDKKKLQKFLNILPEFRSVTQCIKCDRSLFGGLNDDIYIAHVKYCEQNTPFQEHLEVTCTKCGYTWKELCKDATIGDLHVW